MTASFRELGDPAATCAVLIADGAHAGAGALHAARSLAARGTGVTGGPLADGELRLFGWMLAPAACGPLPFELNPVAVPAGDAGAYSGPVDVVAPGILVVPRALLRDPLPADPVVALVELSARARTAGLAVECVAELTAATAAGPLAPGDDRGRAAGLRALAERRAELVGGHRLPAAARGAYVEREVRLGGGRRIRTVVRRPPLTRLVHGPADLAAEALRAELRVRGDRYVLVAAEDALPDAAALDALVEALESAPHVAAAAPDAASLDGRCVLLAAGRFPQHLDASGASLAEALRALLAGAAALRRSVRVPGWTPPPAFLAPPRTASAVLLVASAPEVTRTSLDAALAATAAGDELIGVCAAGGATARRMLGAYPGMRVELDAADPLLTGAVNRALGTARGELIYLLADDVLLPPNTLQRLAAAFARLPGLGAAFPTVPGAVLAEGALDVEYTDLKAMRALAERREAQRSREAEPIDAGGTPAVALAREALLAVGGIDPAYGPTCRGIADLIVRIRRAGYAVVRCEDTLAHRFDPGASRNPLALADRHDSPPPPPAAELLARGFVPEERIPFAPAADGPQPRSAIACVLALPVADDDELARAAASLAAAAAAFGADDPVRVAVLLDGTVSPGEAAAALRAVLAGARKPLAATVAVRIEREPDLAAWRARLEPGVRLVAGTGLGRAALADCTAVAPEAVAGLLETAAR